MTRDILPHLKQESVQRLLDTLRQRGYPIAEVDAWSRGFFVTLPGEPGISVEGRTMVEALDAAVMLTQKREAV